MQRTLLTCITLLFTATLVPAQQVVFDASLPGATFNARFERRTSIKLNARRLLELRMVKKVSFYRANDVLFSFVEFDKNGAITGEAFQESYYFWVRRKHFIEDDTLISTAWYRDGMLERTDTIFILPKSYRNGDTLMRFTVYDTVVYKSGKLLNEQNMYFNARFYKDNKTNYEDELVFLCSMRGDHSVLKATVHGGYISIVDEVITMRHPFYKRYLNTPEDVFFVEGEDLTEPEREGTPNFYRITDPYPPSMEEDVLNEDGLFDSRYLIPYKGPRMLSYYARYDYYK